MADHFNRLTPAQAEVLALLAEEFGKLAELRATLSTCQAANRQMYARLNAVERLRDSLGGNPKVGTPYSDAVDTVVAHYVEAQIRSALSAALEGLS